jgi:hypothetical protein
MQKSGKVSNVKTRKKIKFGEIFFRFLVLKVDSSHTNNFYGLQVEDRQKICSSGKSFFELQSNQRKKERKKERKKVRKKERKKERGTDDDFFSNSICARIV